MNYILPSIQTYNLLKEEVCIMSVWIVSIGSDVPLLFEAGFG